VLPTFSGARLSFDGLYASPNEKPEAQLLSAKARLPSCRHKKHIVSQATVFRRSVPRVGIQRRPHAVVLPQEVAQAALFRHLCG
jgi:hypothetical protein